MIQFPQVQPSRRQRRPSQYHGLKEDIASVGDFIRLYTSRNTRWLSPKFIFGESYGTTRAAGLSDYLQNRYGLYFNGIVLVSSVLNFRAIEFTRKTTSLTSSFSLVSPPRVVSQKAPG